MNELDNDTNIFANEKNMKTLEYSQIKTIYRTYIKRARIQYSKLLT